MGQFAKRTSRLSLADLRETYRLGELREEFCDSNPIVQFEDWFKQAQVADIKEPNAMTLATVGSDGRPSARVVLLKEVSDLGFVFYTNYNSRKGQDLETNPFCALTFYWAELERQVRIEGQAARIPGYESVRYFQSRPKGSRLGALASHQSQIVASRDELERRLGELEEQYRGTDSVPMPDEWGGYRVAPDLVEFWQGRPNRLHDRLQYRRNEGGKWTIKRLSP